MPATISENTFVTIHAESSKFFGLNLEQCENCAIFSSVIEQLNGKQLVMQLLGHDDPNVRYEALLAVQKLMVHNWEYLGKQLEKETGAPGSGTAISAKS